MKGDFPTLVSQEVIEAKINAFGENMRKVRKQRGLTQGNLEPHLGISKGYVGQIERGKSPSLEVFLAICHFFGQSADDMVTPPATGRNLAENKGPSKGNKADRKSVHAMVLNMLDNLSPEELAHVVDMITSFHTFATANKNK